MWCQHNTAPDVATLQTNEAISRPQFLQRRDSQDGRVCGFTPSLQVHPKGMREEHPEHACTFILCQQHLLNCTAVRLEGLRWLHSDLLTLVGPNPALCVSTCLPGHHSITSQHMHRTTTETGADCAARAGCGPPPRGPSLEGGTAVPKAARLFLPSHCLCLSFCCSLAMQEPPSAAQSPVPVIQQVTLGLCHGYW